MNVSFVSRPSESWPLNGKSGRNLLERRPRPILGRTWRRADMNKADDALVRRQTERIEHVAVVGVPFGDPVCAVTKRVRGEDETHGGGPGGKDLLPFRNFDMRAGP